MREQMILTSAIKGMLGHYKELNLNPHVEAPTPIVMVFGDGAFGR